MLHGFNSLEMFGLRCLISRDADVVCTEGYCHSLYHGVWFPWWADIVRIVGSGFPGGQYLRSCDPSSGAYDNTRSVARLAS